MCKITGIIPVKLKSERVKDKNLRKFADSSLFEIKLEQLKRTKEFENFFVSSESKKVLNKAKKMGFETHLRDPKYSTSHVSMSEVYKNIASEIDCEYLAWINVTNPLFKTKNYDTAAKTFKKLNRSKFDCLLSSFQIKDYFFFKDKPLNFKRTPWPRSQDLKGLQSLSFAINILSRRDMIEWRSCVGKKPYLLEFSQLESWDIDFEHDFKFCESIFKN